MIEPRTMRLYVTMVDTVPWEELHIIPRRRVVVIEMTPEQSEKLAPRCVGIISGIARYEEIESCVLQAVEEDANRLRSYTESEIAGAQAMLDSVRKEAEAPCTTE